MTQQASTAVQQTANGGQVATQRNAIMHARHNSKMRLVKIRQHS